MSKSVARVEFSISRESAAAAEMTVLDAEQGSCEVLCSPDTSDPVLPGRAHTGRSAVACGWSSDDAPAWLAHERR